MLVPQKCEETIREKKMMEKSRRKDKMKKKKRFKRIFFLLMINLSIFFLFKYFYGFINDYNNKRYITKMTQL